VRDDRGRLRVDGIGIGLIVLGSAALEILLDRGQIETAVPSRAARGEIHEMKFEPNRRRSVRGRGGFRGAARTKDDRPIPMPSTRSPAPSSRTSLPPRSTKWIVTRRLSGTLRGRPMGMLMRNTQRQL